MKNLLMHPLLILTLSVGFGTIAYAQAPNDPAQATAPQGHYPHNGRMMNPNRQTKMLSRRLGLSPEQSAQLEPILASRDEQMKTLHDNTALDPKTARQQMRGIQEDTNTKVTALLNDTQKQQYQQLLAERRHGRGGSKQSGQAPAPAV